ncbi:MAG: carboxypeptidase-like regulatory domain-containing protein, partial [Longimicrobiales bacterium]
MSLRPAVLLLALAAHAGAVCRVDAQLVRGRVTTPEATPLEGALVELIDMAGRAWRRTLSRETGLFAIDGAPTGRFRLRVERIGYATTHSDPFEIGAADTVFLPLVASTRAIVLAAIVAESEGRCEVRPADGRGTAVLWQEARKALAATQLAAEEKLLRLRAVRYVRELDPTTHRIRAEQGREIVSFSGSPFASIDVETLIRDGFAQRAGGEHLLFGPTADVLLSDAFLDTHCFHVAADEDPSLIGLAFEPLPDRRQPEIRGVLWLSSPGAELQYIEYEFVNLRVRGRANLYHGRTEMARLPSGAWAVTRWWIRSPRLIIRVPSTEFEPEVEYV